MYREGFSLYNANEASQPEKKRDARFEKQEILEKQKILMSKMACQINESVEQYGMKPLVNLDGRIRIENFALENGGIYDDEVIATDGGLVHTAHRSNSGSFERATQDRYRKQYGIETEEGILAHYKEEREMSASNQAEVVITALLHKVLRERFLVVRASEFDDYLNGIDNLILDKETGALICAFDEVVENISDAGKDSKKILKMQAKAEQGGAEAKYGVMLQDDGTLARADIKHIPVFYLNLKSTDLKDLTESLADHFEGEVSPLERGIFTNLVDSIREQKALLESVHLPKNMRRKLSEFTPSLDILRDFCEKK